MARSSSLLKRSSRQRLQHRLPEPAQFLQQTPKGQGARFWAVLHQWIAWLILRPPFSNVVRDFFHSSNSLHWLSQVPPGLQDEKGALLNRGNIYVANSSPSSVLKAYSEQFERDFSLFLRSRAEETKPGGHMVITINCRKSPDPSCSGFCHLFELLAKSLMDMVSEGIIEEEKVDSFNLPFYSPSVQELKAVIDRDGSFGLQKVEFMEVNWDPYDDDDESEEFPLNCHVSGWNNAKIVRAAMESMLSSHFGKGIMDDLFRRYAEHSAEHLSKGKAKHVCLTISMAKN